VYMYVLSYWKVYTAKITISMTGLLEVCNTSKSGSSYMYHHKLVIPRNIQTT
jgi:hypothetical protein